jgi:hypothetical protein
MFTAGWMVSGSLLTPSLLGKKPDMVSADCSRIFPSIRNSALTKSSADKIMIIKYTFPGGQLNNRAVELEYFCRGAAAMNSDNFDWSFNTETNTVTIFLGNEDLLRMCQKLEGNFGQPTSIDLENGKVMCQLCSGKGQRLAMQFEDYKPTGTKREICSDCNGSGVR